MFTLSFESERKANVRIEMIRIGFDSLDEEFFGLGKARKAPKGHCDMGKSVCWGVLGDFEGRFVDLES